MPNESFIEVAVRTWLSLAGSQLTQATSVIWSMDGRKAAIEIHLPKYTALIEMWEHARCLDATVLTEGMQQVTILSAGPCPDDEVLNHRLQRLRSVLRESPSAA